MGWSYGINGDGREVGYGVAATCDQDGCEAEIDRGLSYVCGGMHDGDEWGCGHYFCGAHLFGGGPTQLCRSCSGEYDAAHPEDDEAHLAGCVHCQEREAASERFRAYLRKIRPEA